MKSSFPICPLTQIKPEQLPCQPSSLTGGQDRFQTCIQTDALEKKVPSHLSDSQPLSAQVSPASHLSCDLSSLSRLLNHLQGQKQLSWECHQQDNSCTQPLGPTQATKHCSILGLLSPSPFQSVQKKNPAFGRW